MDAGMGLARREGVDIARAARRNGYVGVWTPGRGDALEQCLEIGTATGIDTAVGVLAVSAASTEPTLEKAATIARHLGGKFALGVGFPSDERSPVETMIRATSIWRALGQPGPLFLGALGPRMLQLAGRLFDGVLLNWCTPRHLAWSRDLVAEGAHAVGRPDGEVSIAHYVRVAVDLDEDLAKRAIAAELVDYLTASTGYTNTSAYRLHFVRSGYEDVVAAIREGHERGRSPADLVALVPEAMVSALGCWGSPTRVASELRRFMDGVDLTIIRPVVAAAPYANGVRAIVSSVRLPVRGLGDASDRGDHGDAVPSEPV